MTQKTSRISLVLLALVLILSAAVYLPGVSGPYVFDDRYNILKNSYLRIDSLHPKDLYYASFSVGSGPLLRPVSMLSFALNYYFAGSFEETTPLKLTNLFIHLANGLLIFWLVRLIFARLSHIGEPASPNAGGSGGLNQNNLLAAATALLWIVHPINLTSVLYIVQRMTALSTLFTLLGLICYMIGRDRIAAGRTRGIGIIGFGLFGCGTLGVLSKENAALLPIFMLALDFILFADQAPWRHWRQLSAHIKRVVLIITFAVVAATAFWVVDFAIPQYESREFTITERVLTESRVLFFYLSMIVLPRIDQFAMHHDDIVLSTSLLSPWTTLPSLFGLLALLALAAYVRTKLPALSLGILWFFIGHLMESTVLPLEIVHEHRNYLACLGILFAFVHLLNRVSVTFSNKRLWLLYPAVAVIFAGTTVLRASHWSDYNHLTRYQAFHHPKSARAQGMLSSLLYRQGDYQGALTAVSQAAALAPHEAGYKINMQLLAARLGVPLSPAVQEEALKILAKGQASTLTQMALEYISNCIAADCAQMQTSMETWLTTLINNSPPSMDNSFLYYLLGRTLIAQGKVLNGLNALERAYQADTQYLHPLFELANTFLALRQIENVEFILQRLRKANENNLHPRDKEIADLESAISKLKAEN